MSSLRLRLGRQLRRCPPVTGPPGELPLKSARERVDIISAYHVRHDLEHEEKPGRSPQPVYSASSYQP